MKAEKRKSLDWSARLKRAFNIDIKRCAVCSGSVKVLACIDNPVVISQILAKMYSRRCNQLQLQECRAPPVSFTS